MVVCPLAPVTWILRDEEIQDAHCDSLDKEKRYCNTVISNASGLRDHPCIIGDDTKSDADLLDAPCGSNSIESDPIQSLGIQLGLRETVPLDLYNNGLLLNQAVQQHQQDFKKGRSLESTINPAFMCSKGYTGSSSISAGDLRHIFI